MEMNLGIDIRQLAEICNFLASDQNHLGDGNGFFADLIGVERQGGPEYTVTIKCRTEFTGREKKKQPVPKHYIERLLEAAGVFT